MAIAVLVQFERDDDAKDLVKHVMASGSVSTAQIVAMPDGHGSLVYRSLKGATVRGVWKIPTKFCDISDGHANSGGKMAFNYTRGQKYGWWVHTKCGMPSPDWGKGGNWDLALGTNLLPQSISGEPRRFGWTKSPMEWTWLIDTLEDKE